MDPLHAFLLYRRVSHLQLNVKINLRKPPFHAKLPRHLLIVAEANLGDQFVPRRVGKIIMQVRVIRQVDLRGQVPIPRCRDEEVDMYVCGPPPRVESIQQWLADQALDGVQLYYEKFTQSNI